MRDLYDKIHALIKRSASMAQRLKADSFCASLTPSRLTHHLARLMAVPTEIMPCHT